MSTNAIIAAEFEDGVKGVYLHSDGYPEGQFGVLNQLTIKIERDGVDKVIRKLLGKPSGWSCIFNDEDISDNLRAMYSDGRFLFVSGYGIQYSRRVIRGMKDSDGGPYRQGDEDYVRPGIGWGPWYVIQRDGQIAWTQGDWPDVSKINYHIPLAGQKQSA